jgi:hypothetical protein
MSGTLFIPNLQIPATHFDSAQRYFDNIGAAGDDSSDAAILNWGGTLVTLLGVSGDNSGLQGVKFDDDIPVGAQFWIMNSGGYNVKLYVPDGKNLFGSSNIASKAGIIVVKMSDDNFWRFG